MPKITIVVGGSFGAGNYAICGKAYDPRFIFAWPNARYAVMGAAQATDTVFSVLAREREHDEKSHPRNWKNYAPTVKTNYEEQTYIRYGAARGWIDAIIQPHDTRLFLSGSLRCVAACRQRVFSHRRNSDLSGLFVSRYPSLIAAFIAKTFENRSSTGSIRSRSCNARKTSSVGTFPTNLSCANGHPPSPPIAESKRRQPAS